jgi:hypothetical protein
MGMRLVFLVGVVFGLVGCLGRSSAKPLHRQAMQAGEGVSSPVAVRTGPLKDHSLGAPQQFEDLSVFPIFADSEVPVGAMTTLDRSIASGTSEVREVGGASRDVGARGAIRHARSRAEFAAESAQVNALVIENKGDLQTYPSTCSRARWSKVAIRIAKSVKTS